MNSISWAAHNWWLKVFENFLRSFKHSSYIWMIFNVIILEQLIDWYGFSALRKFCKRMINDCLSFWRDVVSYILYKIQIQDIISLIKYFLYNTNLLSSQVDSKWVQIQIECILAHCSGIVRIKFFNVIVTTV